MKTSPKSRPQTLKATFRQFNPELVKEAGLWLKLCRRIRVRLQNGIPEKSNNPAWIPGDDWLATFKASSYLALALVRECRELEKSRDAAKLTDEELKAELAQVVEELVPAYVAALPPEQKRALLEGCDGTA